MSTNPTFAFAATQLDPRRSLEKPRRSGLTMVSEWGLGPNAQADFLSIAAPYVDIVKIPTGTARLYERNQLLAKIERYKHGQIRTLVGGQFQEYVLHTEGVAALPRHFDELALVGFDLVEISDNVVAVDDDMRRRMMELALERGMATVVEVGSKQTFGEPARLVEDANRFLQWGAELVIIEGRELMTDGVVNDALLTAIKGCGNLARMMMEVPTPRVGSTTVDIYQVKKALVRAFGPDVNIGNVSPDLVMETETTRLGLGSSGPLSLMH